MTPPKLSQLGVIERLGTERDARDAGAAQGRRIASLVGPGVRLDRDLGILGDPQALTHPGEDPLDLVGRQEGRRAAAEIDRRQRRPPARAGLTEPPVEGIGA